MNVRVIHAVVQITAAYLAFLEVFSALPFGVGRTGRLSVLARRLRLSLLAGFCSLHGDNRRYGVHDVAITGVRDEDAVRNSGAASGSVGESTFRNVCRLLTTMISNVEL